MKVVSLDVFGRYEDPNQPEAVQALSDYEEVRLALLAGTLCVRYIDGDRKGSIARVTFDPAYDHLDYNEKTSFRFRSSSWNDGVYHIENHYFHGLLATWDGRRNKVKLSLPSSDVEILLDYTGPTIWEKFDAKAAKEEILKNPDQKDIDGVVLNIGDRVMYINARYGHRMALERGVITEFKVVADSKSHTIHTIIENVDGTQSSLAYPESMVYKID